MLNSTSVASVLSLFKQQGYKPTVWDCLSDSNSYVICLWPQFFLGHFPLQQHWQLKLAIIMLCSFGPFHLLMYISNDHAVISIFNKSWNSGHVQGVICPYIGVNW